MSALRRRLMVVLVLVASFAGPLSAADEQAVLAITAEGFQALIGSYLTSSGTVRDLTVELGQGTATLRGSADFPVRYGQLDFGRMPAAFEIVLRPAVPQGDRVKNVIDCEIVQVKARVTVTIPGIPFISKPQKLTIDLPQDVVTGIVLPMVVEQLREMPAVKKGESDVTFDAGRQVLRFTFKALDLPTGLPMVLTDVKVTPRRIELWMVPAATTATTPEGPSRWERMDP